MTEFSAQTIRDAIRFYSLLSYCPPSQLDSFMAETAELRSRLYNGSSVSPDEVLFTLIPEVCQRIVTFQSGSRFPDQSLVDELAQAARDAYYSTRALVVYQKIMAAVAAHPGRARVENRLVRKRGCRFCASPCRYGYFVLLTDPDFDLLQRLLAEERSKPVEGQNLIIKLWTFSMAHTLRITGGQSALLSTSHRGNLAYCLLTIATARSRYPLPEQALERLQAVNQQLIKAWEERR